MTDNVVTLRPPLPKGCYTLADLPQRPPIDGVAISTGWWELDEIWRLYPGQFTVVTGIAGSGKSTLMLNVITNIAARGYKSFMFVPENEQSVRDKLRRIWGERPGWDDFSRYLSFVQSAAEGSFGDEPADLRSVLDHAVQAIEREQIEVLLIDPWNELEHLKPPQQLMTDYIREALMYLKRICRYHGAAVIMVAHPTKAVTENGGRVPGLADIEGSMNWYNKCDNGLIVVRDNAAKSTRVISAKVREHGAGRIGICHFHVDPDTDRFAPQHGAVTP
jgi:twinkle protein